jgi:hypothetical protein
VALLRLPARGVVGGGGGSEGAPAQRLRITFEHLLAQGRLLRALSHAQPLGRGVARGIARTPPEGGGVALPDAMCRSRAPAGRFPCSRRARADRAAPPLPPVPRGSLEPLHCRAEAARVLVQEPRSPRVVSTGMIPCTRSSMPIDDGRVQVCWLMVTGAAALATSTSIALAALHMQRVQL